MSNYIVNIDVDDQEKYYKRNQNNRDLIRYIALCLDLFDKYKNIEFNSSNEEYKKDIQKIIDFIECSRNNPIDLNIRLRNNIDADNYYFTNILKEAVMNGHKEIVKMLLDRVDAPRKKDFINQKYHHHELSILKKELARGDPPKYTLIDFVLEKDDLKMFEFLLDNGADINAANTSSFDSPKNDLHLIMSKYREYLQNNTIEITETEKRIGEIIDKKYNSEKNYSHKLPESRSFTPEKNAAEIFKKFGVEKVKDGGGCKKRNKKRTTKRRKPNKKKKTVSNTRGGGSRYNKSNKKKSGKYAE